MDRQPFNPDLYKEYLRREIDGANGPVLVVYSYNDNTKKLVKIVKKTKKDGQDREYKIDKFTISQIMEASKALDQAMMENVI